MRGLRILSLKTTLERVPYTDQWLRQLEARGEFPRRVRLGPNRVGHLEHEVDAWVEARARDRGDRGDAAA